MSNQRKPVVTTNVGALAQFVRTLRLAWRLLKDSRVPTFSKLIVPTTVLYIISPVDLVPDIFLGLGQLDDLGAFFVGLLLFIEMCPRDIVEEHRRAIANETGQVQPGEDNVIEGSYRDVSDEDKR